MFNYYSAKARQAQLLREAEHDRLVKAAKKAKRENDAHKPAQAKSWSNRRLRATRA